MDEKRFGIVLKDVRQRRGVSQADLAEWLMMEQSTLSRVEQGKKSITYSQYIAAIQLLGQGADLAESLLFEGGEVYGYHELCDLRSALRDGKLEEAAEIIDKVRGKPPFDAGLHYQFLRYAEVMVATDLSHDEAIERLTAVMEMTKNDFCLEKISSYHLSHNETTIIGEMATRYEYKGDMDKAIEILRDVRKALDLYRIDEQSQSAVYPAMLYNLARRLGIKGAHDEVIEICHVARRLAVKHNRASILPYILMVMANSERCKGNMRRGQELMQEAYFMARAIEDYYYADIIKKDAKNDFRISIDYVLS